MENQAFSSQVKTDKTKKLIVAIVVVVALAISVGVVLMGDSKEKSVANTSPIDSSKTLPTTELQAPSIDVDQVFQIAKVCRSQFDTSPTLEDDRAVVNKNTNDFGTFIYVKYGINSRDDFVVIWNNQIDALLRYSKATKERNDSDRLKAQTELDTFTTSFSDFLTKQIPTYSKEVAKQDVSDYVAGLKTYIDGFSAKTPTDSRQILNKSTVAFNKFQAELAKPKQ